MGEETANESYILKDAAQLREFFHFFQTELEVSVAKLDVVRSHSAMPIGEMKLAQFWSEEAIDSGKVSIKVTSDLVSAYTISITHAQGAGTTESLSLTAVDVPIATQTPGGNIAYTRGVFMQYEIGENVNRASHQLLSTLSTDFSIQTLHGMADFVSQHGEAQSRSASDEAMVMK